MVVSDVIESKLRHCSHHNNKEISYNNNTQYQSIINSGVNCLPMSVSRSTGRNLLKLTTEPEKRGDFLTPGNGDDEVTSGRKNSKSSGTSSAENLLTCYPDENRNSIIDLPTEINVCEVATTLDVNERKPKKISSAMHSLRNFVRTTVVTNIQSDLEGQDSVTDDLDNASKGQRKKKISITKHRIKKRTRRARDIHNEGASLWQPMDNCCWRSAAGRMVYLEDISISNLCEVELAVLKYICLQSLRERNLDCQISMPKENHVARRRRLKQILLGKKHKEKTDHQEKESKPQNPVFSIDLYQVIENDKAVDKAHEIVMEKLGAITEDDAGNNTRQNNDGENPSTKNPLSSDITPSSSSNYLDRRNSDPPTLDRNYSFSNAKEYDDKEMPDYMRNVYRRRIDTLKEEDEEDTAYPRRRSRLIEALTLSSTSASSTCVLNKESEFTPSPPHIPRVMIQTVEYITKHALNTAGIFRTGGSKKRVRQMREDYDSGYSCVITEESNPHDVAALFKEFLRSLPDPLLTRDLYSAYLVAARQKDQQSTSEILIDLVRLLPSSNRDTLELTLKCLRKVADNAVDRLDDDDKLIPGNKMDAKNLATLMAPNILHRCKTYKTSTAYQADTLNPEDNKAAIDVVFYMIDLNEELFRIPGYLHDQILRALVEEEPELVDYVLRKKAARSSFTESTVSENIHTNSQRSTRRSLSSARTLRTRYSLEEVSFQKSNSFNQGPYKPFIRRRKESTGSRPSSSRSDPADRSSIRTSGLGTPPTSDKFKRKSSRELIDQDPSSLRDSGIVFNSTPPFQRNSQIRCSREYIKISPMPSPPSSKSNIVYRKHSRDRESRDSAYASGVREMLNSRKSNPPSLHINSELENHGQNEENTDDLNSPTQSSCSTSTESKIDYLNDILNEPSFLPVSNNVVIKARKISLPAMCISKVPALKSPTKSNSVDCEITLKKDPNSPPMGWAYHPDWKINVRDSQFPSQETTL